MYKPNKVHLTIKSGFAFLFLNILMGICFNSQAQKPAIHSVYNNSTTINQYDKFEATISLSASYTNPYDYDDIVLKGIFTTPSGKKDTIEGFFMQEFSLNETTGNLNTNGSGNFKIRYAPSEIGTYSYIFYCQNLQGVATSIDATFKCISVNTKGFVRKNNTNYLNFDNGEQYFPIGENLAWQQSNKYLDYKKWTDQLANNNANFIRLWQCWWGLGIEWSGALYNGLKNYSQINSFYTDLLLEECNKKNLYMMLCINHHGMVSTKVNPEWNTNPYNKANGGPCNNTWDYFTNSTAKALHKNRLRYIIARWGYSKNIMSWELFNEVDWTDDFINKKNTVKDWHIEMASFIKTKDPFKHLVSTSYYNNADDANTWSSNWIDFTQVHNYIGSSNIENELAQVSNEYLQQFQKPVLNGEFGINTSNSALSTIDPNGIHIHNGIWATAFSGAMGAAMTWWWDSYIDPQNLYAHFKPLSNLIASISLKKDNYKKTTTSLIGGGTADLLLTPAKGFEIAGAGIFTINNNGDVSPSSTQLSNYLFGNEWNTQYRNPPTFLVNYSTDGQFKVTTGSSSGTKPTINIYLDDKLVLAQSAAINNTYSISISSGAHKIKVDNLGTDWISINNYVFTKISPPLNTYILKSADSTKIAGWLHSKIYNWVDAGPNGSVPAAIKGASIIIPEMQNTQYIVNFTDCLTGNNITTQSAIATNHTLTIPLPNIAWDAAITVVPGTITALVESPSNNRSIKIFPNPSTNGTIIIKYALNASTKINIALYDQIGNHVSSIFSGIQSAGNQTIQWNSKLNQITPGLYLLKLQIGHKTYTEKIIIAAY